MRKLQITLNLVLILLFAAVASAKIVFTSTRNGHSDIYVMDDTGENIIQITDDPDSERRPRWSPDGKQIAFVRDTDPSDDVIKINAYIMNADGTNVRQLTNYKAGIVLDLVFSSNGKRLMFSTSTSIGVIEIRTGESNLIYNKHTIHIDWSPDKRHIVFVNDEHQFLEQNLWIMDANGDNARAWTQPDPEKGTIHRYSPRWSPDGKQILYTESDIIVEKRKDEHGNLIGIGTRAAGTFRYMIRNMDDGDTQTLEIPEDWIPSSVAWMDGKRSVLFSSYKFEMLRSQDPGTQIYKYDIASAEITQLTSGVGGHWISGGLAVSPAGKYPVRWGEIKKAYSD